MSPDDLRDDAMRAVAAFAAAAARRARSERIEPLHLLVAILELLDGLLEMSAQELGLPPAQVAAAAAAAPAACAALGLSDGEITRLRRALRRAEPPAADAAPGSDPPWSPAAADLWERAALLASGEPGAAVTAPHLVRALLLDPPAEAAGALPQAAERKPALAWETRVDELVSRFQPAVLTLVLTDMEGSTAIKRRLGDREAAKVFRAHDDLVRGVLAATPGGEELKTIGDAFLLAFAAPEAALAFCLGVQARLRAHEQLRQVPLRVRMGVFAGPVLRRVGRGSGLSDPVFGIAIDTTARIASLASGGQVLTDRGVHEAARDRLGPLPGVGPVEWRCHGPFVLKGLAEPLEVFEVGEAAEAPFVAPRGGDKARPQRRAAAAPAARPPTPTLDELGRDLTALARAGRLPPVVGRRAEMRALARFLQRTSKRNVLLVGEPGVGKSALVEGVAERFAAAGAPEFLRRLRIVQLSVADLVAGTRYRGDLEERLQRLLAEATADPDLVLFLDEVHLVVRSGGEGGVDVANALKPALAGDRLRCIGATTTDEMERHLAKDRALLRRFQVLRVEEPTAEETLLMCRQWARRIEELQEVEIEEAALEAAVELSVRLQPSRRLPDKAIDLLENAAAAAKVTSLSFDAAAPRKERPRVGRAEVVAALGAEEASLPPAAEDPLVN
jgi:class 3 adenylate cyclase